MLLVEGHLDIGEVRTSTIDVTHAVAECQVAGCVDLVASDGSCVITDETIGFGVEVRIDSIRTLHGGGQLHEFKFHRCQRVALNGVNQNMNITRVDNRQVVFITSDNAFTTLEEAACLRFKDRKLRRVVTLDIGTRLRVFDTT